MKMGDRPVGPTVKKPRTSFEALASEVSESDGRVSGGNKKGRPCGKMQEKRYSKFPQGKYDKWDSDISLGFQYTQVVTFLEDNYRILNVCGE